MPIFTSRCLMVVMAAVGACCIAATAEGQEHPFADRILNALFDPRVQRDLELVDEQKTQLEGLMKGVREKQKELGESLKAYSQVAPAEEVELRRQEMVEQFEGIKQNARQSILNELLPHQHKRLKQLAVQLSLQASAKKNGAGILAPEMIRYLEIDDEQAERLRHKTEELRSRLAAELKRLTDEAREELMEELSAPQREKYEELVGRPIDQQSDSKNK